jgi:hypothetical protein
VATARLNFFDGSTAWVAYRSRLKMCRPAQPSRTLDSSHSAASIGRSWVQASHVARLAVERQCRPCYMGGPTLVFWLAVLVMLGASPAFAEHVQKCEGRTYKLSDAQEVVCSATWQFTGTCNGHDMWNEWKVTGRTSPPDAFVRPWLDVPIFVVGYELLKLPAARLIWPWDAVHNWINSWFAIGTTMVPDAMLWLGAGETHVKQIWSKNAGQLWPSVANSRALSALRNETGTVYAYDGDLLDIHGRCFGGAPVTILLTIYYTPLEGHALDPAQ